MIELLSDVPYAIWLAIENTLIPAVLLLMPYWVAGSGALIGAVAVGGFVAWRYRYRNKAVAALAVLTTGLAGAALGGLVDGVYPRLKFCAPLGVQHCLDEFGIAPAAVLIFVLMVVAASGDSQRS